MKWQCPRPDRARQDGCLDIAEDGSCNRKEWTSISYFKGKAPHTEPKAEVYCERIKCMLREL